MYNGDVALLVSYLAVKRLACFWRALLERNVIINGKLAVNFRILFSRSLLLSLRVLFFERRLRLFTDGRLYSCVSPHEELTIDPGTRELIIVLLLTIPKGNKLIRIGNLKQQ